MSAVGYWPWWLAAAALGTLSVGAWLQTRRPLGASGVIQRVGREAAGSRPGAGIGGDGARRPAGPGRGA
jgi:hypothetical protein